MVFFFFFFFLGNFGGDKRVWLSFGGWCCMGCRRETKRQIGNGDEREKRETKFLILSFGIFYINLMSCL